MSDTVITFHESPVLEPAPAGADPDDWKAAQIKNMRANSLDVLLQQSVCGIELYKKRPLSQNSIREALGQVIAGVDPSKPELSRVHSDIPPLGSTPGISLEDEGTSRLFYYLFEDYAAAGPLKAARMILEDIVSVPTQKQQSPVLISKQTPKVLTSVVCVSSAQDLDLTNLHTGSQKQGHEQ